MKKKNLIIAIIFILINCSVDAQCPQKTEEQWKEYFAEKINQLDPIEGRWSTNMTESIFHYWYSDDVSLRESPLVQEFPPNPYTNVVYKHDNVLYGCACFVKDKSIPDPLNLSVIYKKTSSTNIYLREEHKNGRLKNNTNVVLTNGIMLEYELELNLEEKVERQKYINKKDIENNRLLEIDNPTDDELKNGLQYTKITRKFKKLKIFPTSESIGAHSIGSGTGFAITSNGYIVTNNHVVDGAKDITVKGINGNFQKEYKAVIVGTDKNNDLAIIKITDNSFTSLGKVPYTITNKTSDVGSSVFVLGYPLRASMGDEIKLTNGIISSKSGYQGDITTYQISVPLQPGNSGGAMFDNKGNIIGVANSKLVGAENASYAIKTTYL